MPIGLSKKAVTKGAPNAMAKRAVEEFENQLALLNSMREEFEATFPEASSFLEDILRQEDEVRSSIDAAIPLVRDARQTIGDFKCQIKKSKPRYDDKAFMALVEGLEDSGPLLSDLLEGGHVKKISLDPSVAAYLSQRPDVSDYFQDAWRDAEEMTPAVTPPKI